MIPPSISPEWSLDWFQLDLLYIRSCDTFINAVGLLGKTFKKIPHLLSAIPHVFSGVGVEPLHKRLWLNAVALRENSEVGFVPCVVDHCHYVGAGKTGPCGTIWINCSTSEGISKGSIYELVPIGKGPYLF